MMKFLVVAFLLALASSTSAGVYKTIQEIEDGVNNLNNKDTLALAAANKVREAIQDRITNRNNADDATLDGVYETREENEDQITNYYNADALTSAGVNETYEKIEDRITNGHSARAGQFPYQAFLIIQYYKKGFTCGGSLIGRQWVLTAAHCTIDAESVIVYLGSIRRLYGTSYTVYRENVINHQGYNRSNLNNDISLVKIPAVSLNSRYIQPIKLPAISNYFSSYAGENVIVSGWGQTANNGFSKYLQWARLQAIANNICAATFGSRITSGTICARNSCGIAACFGDSGGPMVLENSKILIGVTSFLYPANCQSGYPTAFTRITSYLDWIKYNTGIYYT